ncbi:MAG: hypothetical protein DMG16_16080 [Acidobacteria bacterium]|nr:MAG: hypothetical protein DMG16_16080 [Acidobacteriota bacterium]
MKILTSVIILTALVTPLAAQWLQRPTPGIPRTADGKPNLTAPAPRTADAKPDLTGLWQMLSADTAVGNVALRKPGDLQSADIQPWVQALLQQRAENFGIDNPHYRCLPDGPNYSTGGGMKRILQTPAMIVILQEDLTYRQIHMDGRALETDPNPSWMGYSVGHWEGDTLVVESNGYNDRTWLLGGYPHTEALRMTERFRRTDFGHMEIAVTFDDPKAYNKPWTFPLSARLAADTELMEAVCNERPDNGQQHWIGKASDAQKSAAKVAPEILAKYVGVYKGIYLRNPRTVEVTFSGGTLSVSVNGGPKQPVFPQSETNFSGTGLSYQFIRDDHGIATHVVEGHISGDYKFERQN